MGKFNRIKSIRLLALVMIVGLYIPAIRMVSGQDPFELSAKKTSKSSKGGKGGVSVVYKSPDGKEWIHKGSRSIYITKDSLGVVRAMAASSYTPTKGKKYAEAVNRYHDRLKDKGVTVYSLIAPSQGAYYMPESVQEPRAEQRTIEASEKYYDPDVVVVFVDDTLKNHTDEEIYNRTDHHWAPLGAYYAAAALAEAAEVDFLPLSEYEERTLHDYVGTMYKFSGDPEVKAHPEDFVYYLPPEGYVAQFINYKVSGGKTVSESAPKIEPFFKEYKDGSGSAYCTFMGGDTRTVKVTNTGGTPGRKLLIVKDSFGNAMASNLFGSFEEVHVIDFRYFPHNLVDYVEKEGITDLVFVNTISIGFAPNTADRLNYMFDHGKSKSSVKEVVVTEEEVVGTDDEEMEIEE